MAGVGVMHRLMLPNLWPTANKCRQLLCLRDLHISSSTAVDLPLERLQDAVGTAATQLEEQGFAVVDDVFGATCAMAVRHEVTALHEAGSMHLNATHLVRSGGTTLLQKRGIYEAEVQQQEVADAAPLLGQLQRDSTLRTLLSVYLPHLRLTSQAIKAQCNEGRGACFPMHFDSDDSLDGRRLSAIFYLNPGWQRQHGGQLRLFPFGQRPIDISPLHDRMVLFASTRMLHRVMPAQQGRVCFTVWMSETLRPGRLPPQPPTALLQQALADAHRSGGVLTDEAAEQLLRHPDIQKLLAKLHYADDWADSIKDSHDDNEGRAAALATFWHEVELLKRVLQPLQLAAQRAFPPSAADSSIELV